MYTSSLAANYDQIADTDDGSCLYCDLSTTIVSSPPSSPSLCDGFGISSSTSSFPIISYSWITSQGLLVSSNDIAFNLCTEGYIITVNDSLGCSTVDSLVLGNPYALGGNNFNLIFLGLLQLMMDLVLQFHMDV